MSAKKNKKPNNKIISGLLLLAIALVIVYILYKVIALIAVPSDVVVIENGIITSEESANRIYNKRWRSGKGKQYKKWNISDKSRRRKGSKRGANF